MSVALAEGTYRAEDGATITIKISDNGGMGGLAAMAQAGFAMAEVDRETETGYERSTTIKGYRAMEKYDSQYKTGSITIMAEKRLMFEIEGQGVPMEKITAAVDNARAWSEVDDPVGLLWSFTGGGTVQNRWKSMSELPAETVESKAMSKELKRRGFRFVGPTICYAFMQATGMVNDHVVGCFRHDECAALA